jgi:hypothetical protein
MEHEVAIQIYNNIRRQFHYREIPGYNFEGCEWFEKSGEWCRENKNGVIMRVVEDGLWLHIKCYDVFYIDPEIGYRNLQNLPPNCTINAM